jgi:hypothetical protein
MAIAHINDASIAIDPDSDFPYRNTPMTHLARALQEQWANEEPANWAMVSEVVTRAIRGEQSSSGHYEADGTYIDSF